MYEGATLKDAMQDLRQDSLFWTREVYERCQTRGNSQTPIKGKSKGQKGTTWTTRQINGQKDRPRLGPLQPKARASPRRKTKASRSQHGLRPGQLLHPMESRSAVTFTSRRPAKATVAVLTPSHEGWMGLQRTPGAGD